MKWVIDLSRWSMDDTIRFMLFTANDGYDMPIRAMICIIVEWPYEGKPYRREAYLEPQGENAPLPFYVAIGIIEKAIKARWDSGQKVHEIEMQ